MNKATTPAVPAEGSKRDVETTGHGKEGSKREEAFDRGVTSKQTHAPASHRDHKMRGGHHC